MRKVVYSWYVRWLRIQGRLYSLLLQPNFAKFGSRSVILPPSEIRGLGQIAIGSAVYIGPDSLLYALPKECSRAILIHIGDNVSITGFCTISAVREVVLENDVLMARNVYISDHGHRFDQAGIPIRDQGISNVAPVRIGRGAWLGQNVVVCPGVTIGRGSVIGANSVVKSNIPDYCVAAGAPATVRRHIDFQENAN